MERLAERKIYIADITQSVDGRQRRSKAFTFGFILCALLSGSGLITYAKWARGTEVPLERLLKNTTEYIARNPNDAQGYYLMGRLHSLAYATEMKEIPVFNDKAGNQLPSLPSYMSVIPPRSGKKPDSLTAQAKEHLRKSIENYQKATELAPNDAVSFLGLAWVLEDGAVFASRVKAFPKEKKADTLFWKEKSLTAYRQAYGLTIKGDLKKRGLGPGANEALSVEAGEAILRLMKSRKPSAAEQQELSEIEKNIATVRQKPRAITPIIFPLDSARSLQSLLAENQATRFNLAGDDRLSLWPWVRANTGILVWDGQQTGRIESGRQMFGSVTWWMSWRDGYQPMMMLDDNHDGWLTDQELRGIAVWQDHNSNGVSDAGEVKPVQAYGIEAIAVTPEPQTDLANDNVPQNLHGLRMRDGSFLPTYDWTPQEIRHQPQTILTTSRLK